MLWAYDGSLKQDASTPTVGLVRRIDQWRAQGSGSVSSCLGYVGSTGVYTITVSQTRAGSFQFGSVVELTVGILADLRSFVSKRIARMAV